MFLIERYTCPYEKKMMTIQLVIRAALRQFREKEYEMMKTITVPMIEMAMDRSGSIIRISFAFLDARSRMGYSVKRKG